MERPSSPDEPPAAPGSVSRLIPDLKTGERRAVQALWERYFRPLVAVARGRLPADQCRAAGAEGVAADAFLEFCDRLARPDAARRFPRSETRDHLWRLLVCFTARAAFDHGRKQARRQEIEVQQPLG